MGSQAARFNPQTKHGVDGKGDGFYPLFLLSKRGGNSVLFFRPIPPLCYEVLLQFCRPSLCGWMLKVLHARQNTLTYIFNMFSCKFNYHSFTMLITEPAHTHTYTRLLPTESVCEAVEHEFDKQLVRSGTSFAGKCFSHLHICIPLCSAY